MQASAVTTKEGPCGGGGGLLKDMDTTGIIRIVKISIRHGDAIDALIVVYERLHNGVVQFTQQYWGGNGGMLTEVRDFHTFSNIWCFPTVNIDEDRVFFST